MNKLLIMIAVFASLLYGQISAELNIENQHIAGTDFFFDLYLTRTNTGDLYLGNADFILTFDASNFDSPVFTKEGESPAFCTFVPAIQSPMNNLFTQDLYFNNTAVDILNVNWLVINLNSPAPSTQLSFDTRMARIDDTPLTHRLGRFRVSGIINPNGFINLRWRTVGSGLTTTVFTLNPVYPWYSSEVIIDAIDPPNLPLPVELTSFVALVSGNQVELTWESKTEINNYGFEIEKSSALDDGNKTWSKIGFVTGNGNSNSPKKYSFVDANIKTGSYYYRLKQIDIDGQFEYSPEVLVAIESLCDYSLGQNFPNPFNPTTKIKFSIPEAGFVKLTIYNVLGQEVLTLLDEQRQPGEYTVVFDASVINSGVYFYEIRVNQFTLTKKMQLLK